MAGTESTIEIKAPIKRVYEVIADFASYPEFLPETKEVVIEKANSKSARVTFTVNIVKKVIYTLDIVLNPHEGMSWSLVKGDFMKQNNGRWLLSEKGKGCTQADYLIDVDFGFLVPKAISNKLVASNLPAMLKAFKERIEELN